MDFYILSAAEVLLYIRNDAEEAVHLEDEYLLQVTFPIKETKPLERGQLIGFYDLDGNLQLFEIRVADPREPAHTIYIEAEHAALAELTEEIIEDVRPTDAQASEAVIRALEGSRWELGSAVETALQSTTFYDIRRWAALKKITEVWGVALAFQWLLNENSIDARYVNVLPRMGAARGKRFEIDKDITAISCRYEDRHVRTAMYGRGKGEEVGVSAAGDPTYSRRINFEDEVWSIAEGDPADKPAGHGYVEDVAATVLYGRMGRPRVDVKVFEDCTDPAELLQRTWDYLQTINSPLLTITATVEDLESLWGEQHEAIRMGDDVAVIVQPMGVEVYALITKLARNLLLGNQTRVTIGNYREDITDRQVALETAVQSAAALGRMGADVAAANPGFVRGVIDTMITQILSSGTNRHTDPVDGGDIYEADDGSSAMKLTGNGWMIAASKIGGVWQWTTAATGRGFAAEAITAGIIRAVTLLTCVLESASGTFTHLTTGEPDHARMEHGTNPDSGEPFIQTYDFHNTKKLGIDMDEITYPNGIKLAEFAIGGTVGVGLF